MYGTLALTPKALDDYRPLIGDRGLQELRDLGTPLRGLRVLHLSATAFGTGVAELLNAAIPLFLDIGIDCQWQVVRPAEEFLAVNKALYRALAGFEGGWSPELSETWLRYSAMNAELFSDPFDVVIVHDPQPAAIRSFVPNAPASRWVLHSHLDLSSAQPDAWALLRAHIEPYNAIVFDASEFVHPDLDTAPVTIIKPAIDPLGPRNMELAPDVIETILRQYGIDSARPLISQISPCDPSCDFLGCIDVFDRVRRDTAGLQLALIVANPPEDDASIAYFDETVRKSMEYSDVYILRGVSEVGNVETNALQRSSSVVLQKGLRKGFGLWVSDAQWKERPVVAARSGGLQQQVLDGETGFLADTTGEFSDCVAKLLREPELSRRLGQNGRRHVQEHFLLPRFLEDELHLLQGLTRAG